jgi:molybdopterin-guanine dinucleotide biosynthesis protein A
VAGIILAGGQATRMGRDKANLPLGELTLLLYTAQALAQVCAPVVVVVDRRDRYRLPEKLLILEDAYPNAGPLGGILTALETLPEGYHLVTACDMPRLRAETLRLLLREAQGYDAAAPEIAGRLEPLCAVYHTRCLPLLKERFDSGERALHRALRRVSLRRVAEAQLRSVDPDLSSLINVNTPEDYRSLIEGENL